MDNYYTHDPSKTGKQYYELEESKVEETKVPLIIIKSPRNIIA